jgi:hypothetical protein
MKAIDNPVEALVAVGKENSELHEELARVYAEVDRYRVALQMIMLHPGDPGAIARAALANRNAN